MTTDADGAATIETYSVRYDWPIRTGIIVGRLDADERGSWPPPTTTTWWR